MCSISGIEAGSTGAVGLLACLVGLAFLKKYYRAPIENLPPLTEESTAEELISRTEVYSDDAFLRMQSSEVRARDLMADHHVYVSFEQHLRSPHRRRFVN